MTTENQHSTDCKCPFLDRCTLLLHHENRMPNLIDSVKKYYCTNHISQCARKWIYETIGQNYVPPLLLPNQWEWAESIASDLHDEGELKNFQEYLKTTRNKGIVP